MKHWSPSRAGFTLLEIMIVTTILGLFVAIAVPNFIIARSNAQRTSCINNLRQIDTAKQQFAFEAWRNASAQVNSTDIAPYLGRNDIQNVYCPQDPTRTIASSYDIGDLKTIPMCVIQPSGPKAHALR